MEHPGKIAVIIVNFELWFYHTLMHPKDANGMKNSVDPDQTAPDGYSHPTPTLALDRCLLN